MSITAPQRQVYHWSAREFQRAVEAGVFDEDARLELIRGEIITMSPKGVRHIAATNKTLAALTRALSAENVCVRKEDPIILPLDGQPYSDVCVLRGTEEDYRDRIPLPQDVLLVVEVADTSPEFDTREKKRDYAAAGIPEYWVLDLNARTLKVYTDPQGQDYQREYVWYPGDTVSLTAFPNVQVRVSDLLP